MYLKAALKVRVGRRRLNLLFVPQKHAFAPCSVLASMFTVCVHKLVLVAASEHSFPAESLII